MILVLENFFMINSTNPSFSVSHNDDFLYYINSAYGISLKYPTDWKISEDIDIISEFYSVEFSTEGAALTIGIKEIPWKNCNNIGFLYFIILVQIV
jgi:hypothetical protein